MATSGGEQVRSRAHPMVPSARPEEECGGLATRASDVHGSLAGGSGCGVGRLGQQEPEAAVSTQGTAHTHGATQLGRRQAGLAWPRAQVATAAAAPVATRYGDEGRPRMVARGQGEYGGAGDGGCRVARRSEVEERRRGARLGRAMATAAASLSVLQTRARGRKRMRARGKADGRGLHAVDSGQRRQAGHGAWQPRGGSGLLPVGHSIPC